MTSLYECSVADCDWRNPNWRYGLAEAGATWAEHAAEHASAISTSPASESQPTCDLPFGDGYTCDLPKGHS